MQPSRPTSSSTRRSRRRVFLACVSLAAAGALAAPDLLAFEIRPLEDPPPAILGQIAEDPGLNRVTLTVDGSRAAAAVVEQLKELKFRSTIHFYPSVSQEPAQVTLAGEVRDLLFSPDGESLFALFHNPAKKRPGDVNLLVIDTNTQKTKRRIRLPPSAIALAYWPQGNALLVVCAHEIRSVLLPEMHSGPLYRLIGVNTSAAVLDGARLLVGRDDGLVLIDLRDPPGEEQMPVRLRIEANPVARLAANEDASLILLRWLDGGLASVSLGESSLAPELGDGVLPIRPWPARESVPGLPPEFEPEPPVPVEAATVVVAEIQPEADVERAAEHDLEETTAAVEPVVAAVEPPPVPAATAGIVATEPPLEETTKPPPPPPPPPPTEHDGPAPQLTGKLSGPGLESVSSVVLLGPDSIVRVATRVTPDSDGRWQVAGLAPGRYRIQLAGDVDQVPVADPPFHVVQIQADQPTAEVNFQVLESR